MSDYDDLRALAEAATPGPWVQGDPFFGGQNAQCVVSVSEAAMGRDVMGPTLRPALFDVEWIAAANPARVLALLAERDALAARLAASEAIAQAAREYVRADRAYDEAFQFRDWGSVYRPSNVRWAAYDALTAAVDAELEAQR